LEVKLLRQTHRGEEGEIKVEPVAVLARKLINRRGAPVAQLLVRWSNLPDDVGRYFFYEDKISRIRY